MTEKKFAVVWDYDGQIVGNKRPAIFNTRAEGKEYLRERNAKSFRLRAKVVEVSIRVTKKENK